uniref:Uncharacterized protein n=1 Tax=Trichobilharzia regenti TaxID=157069 RepID=A0AA85KIC5_TRIRE|nr:unnamed protein product [Trichobilharzia regenti]
MFDVTKSKTYKRKPTNWSMKQLAKTGLQMNVDKMKVMNVTNQPTTTSSANHHQWEGFEIDYFIHLSREHCLNSRQSEQTRMSNRGRIGKASEKHVVHQPETDLGIFVTQPAWRVVVYA